MKSIELKLGALFLASMFLLGAIPFADAQGIYDKNREARQRYAEAQSDFSNMKREYQSAKQGFLEAKQNFGVRDQATMESARNFVGKAIDATISHLTRMRSFVESDWALEESDKARIVSEIDTEIAWLEARKAEIPDASREELVSIGKTVQDRWKNTIRADLKAYTGEILNARAQWLLAQTDEAITVAGNEIAKAQSAGKDVSEAKALLDDAIAKRELAESKYESAKESFNGIGNLNEADKLFKEGYSFIKEGNNYILDAYQSLKKINSELRN